ncbi:uncharacterized protein KZ484_023712 isoform 1-T2 [Pholidichthys leucotaenia]
MSTEVDREEIIILSDDDDGDCKTDQSCFILEVEDTEMTAESNALFPKVLDEDLVVTFSRTADVLPHARYDCPVHPFIATDAETDIPLANNHFTCDQCFCYICDRLASECQMWCEPGACHCNSHKRSNFWSELRNQGLLGALKDFNFTLLEVDPHLRYAESCLRLFRFNLAAIYSSYLKGNILQQYGLTQQGHFYNYRPVFDFVSSFLDKADQQNSRAAAIMNLGAVVDFNKHVHLTGSFILQCPMANAATAKMILLQRVITSILRLIVMGDLTSDFIFKLQKFYIRIYFTTELRIMKNSLCVRLWDDVLLVSVLKGQNIVGFRNYKGKKDILSEPISVVLLRTELLQRQHRYRELCRYLRIIQTDDSARLQQIKDLIAFFMCLCGDFTGALDHFFISVNSSASRLTPHLFCFYLRIFETATAPQLIVTQPEQLYFSTATWESIKDVVPLKRAELVKFALRAQRFCPTVFMDSQCWTSLLTIVNKPSGSFTSIPAPSPQFLNGARDNVKSILLDLQHSSNLHIPRLFQEEYPDQALLLLVTGAFGLRLRHTVLCPLLPVLSTFKENQWAFKWLCDDLSSSPEHHKIFFDRLKVAQKNLAGNPSDSNPDSSHLELLQL